MLVKMKSIIKLITQIPRRVKRLIVVILDILICIVSVWIAFYLRLGNYLSVSEQPILPVVTSIAIFLPLSIYFKLHRMIFRFNDVSSFITIIQTITIYGTCYATIFTLFSVEGTPRTIGIIQPILMLLFIISSRIYAKLILADLYTPGKSKDLLRQVLIYGAGQSGRQLAGAINISKEMRVKGFLDDDVTLKGSFINGLPIFSPANLDQILNDLNIDDILLALPSVPRYRRSQIIQSMQKHKISIRTMPSFDEIATGKLSLADIKELEVDDLLCRDSVQPDPYLLELHIFNKTVLITGAGGSIGSELCRQIIKLKPKKLLLLDICEYSLYKIHQELFTLIDSRLEINSTNFPNNKHIHNTQTVSTIEIVPLLASACNSFRIEQIFQTWKPQTIYHTAAYKHVPMVEHNVSEGILNNVFGTLVCAQLSYQYRVNNFVLVSTDKAVRPTNIMGASKRLAEMILQALNDFYNSGMAHNEHVTGNYTKFSMVRFGNVLGSSGSVVPKFREQIKNGGPVTLTHPEVTRYFMTIPEAAQLVIQASAMAEGGDMFVLDMGQPIKIFDLARRIIQLSGLSVREDDTANGDIEIKIVGLRPGEKLYEELLIGDNPQHTSHPQIMKAHEEFLPWSELNIKLVELQKKCEANDIPNIQIMLQELVSGYEANNKIVDLVYTATALGHL